MSLKRFVRNTGTGDKFATGDNLGKPIWVQPIEKFSGLVTDYDPDGTKVVLRANVYDMEEKQAYGRVVFFNDALCDGLGQFIGSETVVRFADVKTKDGKRSFRSALEGTDADYEMAESMLDTIHAEIAARLAELDSDAVPVSDAPKQNSAQADAVKGAFKR